MSMPPVAPAAGHVHAEALTFTYASTEAPQLRSVSFEVAKGERVAIMGATGAGKTTLAMSLNGLVPHHYEGELTGTLAVAGRTAAASDVTDLVQHVGLVMQDPESQITGRTALDDAAVGPANLGLSRAEVFARAEHGLRRVGLADLRDRDTAEMSGGQQQRLAIAGILAMEPEILVLDEPTSELDPAGAEQVFDVVREVAAESSRANSGRVNSGRTVLLVEHEPELVAAWADRLLVLAGGSLIYNGPPAGFFSEPHLVAEAGLRPPGVVSVVAALREHGLLPRGPACGAEPAPGIPMTVPEAVSLLRPHLPAAVAERHGAAERLPEAGRLSATERLPAAERRAVWSPASAPTDSAEVAVEAKALTHCYPSGVEALTEVDLLVREGEFVALLGRNGAGKTTFARHLNGLLRPTSGSVEINGRTAAGCEVHQLSTEVGYVFQNPDHQIFAPTVAEEIGFGLKNLGHAEAEIRTRVAEVLDQVGMPGTADLHPYRLGKGQRQRLAVASVLALRPRILVVDEPTTGQDWNGSVAIMELVRGLNQAGHTILVITHDMLLAARYARRAVVFDSGRVRADRPTRELFADADLLVEAQLRPPQLTELALALGLGPLTSVDEYLAAWGGVGVP